MQGEATRRFGQPVRRHWPINSGAEFPVRDQNMPGLDHGTIIAGAMPDVFKFFTKHTK
jgi:hypothetical protein